MDATTIALVSTVGGSPVVLLLVRHLLNRPRKPGMHAIQDEVVDLRSRLQTVENTQRLTLDYVELLRRHISEEKPPPPPPWPESLTR